MVAWDRVTRANVLHAIKEYDQLGPEQFFSEHGFAPTTTYDLIWEERRYPPKAILGTAYELATGQRLASTDFEGGKTGAVRVLGQLGIYRPGNPSFSLGLIWPGFAGFGSIWLNLDSAWIFLGCHTLHIGATDLILSWPAGGADQLSARKPSRARRLELSCKAPLPTALESLP